MSYNKSKPRPISTLQPLIQSTYSPKQRYTISFPAESPHTKQEFKDEADINILMSRYMSTGALPNLNERAPQYLDATGYDFAAAMDYIAEAKSLFAELPASIRTQFDNNPAAFLDFCSKEKNRPELAEMGLLKPIHEWAQPTPSPLPSNPAPAFSGPSGEVSIITETDKK
ncbi:MAG: internal scaffolding protein [Microviridae sp.]|nr:MAG: internal scaffolding protein [Microviridae sp.]